MVSMNSQPDPQLFDCVSFELAGEFYCIDVLCVKEIRFWEKPKPMPQTPDYIAGVMNFRGDVIPIIDLASRAGLPELEPNDSSRIIIIECNHKTYGMVVSDVHDIMGLDLSEMQRPEEFAPNETRFVLRGVVTKDNELIRVVDKDELFPVELVDAA